MKNLILVTAIVFGLSSFKTLKPETHSCTYNIISTTTFQVIGQITVTDVPNMVSCDDKSLIADVSAYVNNQ